VNTLDMYDHTNRSYARADGPPGVEVAQWAYELDTLEQLYAQMAPSVVVEIGVMAGGTLWRWIRTAVRGATIIGMDTVVGVPAWWDWADENQVNLKYAQGDSHGPEAFEMLKALLGDRMIDFLFIDADHTEEGATRDFETYSQLVRAGGAIALHDIIDPAPERNQDHIRVSRLWRRLQRAGYVNREIVAHPGQPWGGIGVVYK